jgi:plasmid replication initiation protein
MAARVWACLVSIVREDDIAFRELIVPAKSVLEYAGGDDYKVLKITCDRLSSCVLDRVSNDGAEVLKYSLFSAIRYEDGLIFARFHPDLQPVLLGLKSNFTEYALEEFLKLPSIYSQKLFEYLKSWACCAERVEDIETIYAILGIPEYIRANFKDFRYRMLDKAHQDISKFTSLRYEWEAVKKGVGKTSPVIAVCFIFSPGRQAKNREERKKASEKKVRDERNKLFMESVKCLENKLDCKTPKRTARCAVCFKSRGSELPEFLQGQIPEYEQPR